MDTIQLDLNKGQIINLFNLMSDADKVELYEELRKSLFAISTTNALDNRRTIGILSGKATFKEIGDGKITEKEFFGL
jgi:hypothetical protein